MNLHEYPYQIAEVAQQINALESEIAHTRNAIARLEGLAELEAAFSPDLKNDQQRRSRRFEILKTMDNYQPLQDRLIELAESKSNLMAELEKLRNLFTAAKLQMRFEIAQKLSGSEFGDFVGV